MTGAGLRARLAARPPWLVRLPVTAGAGTAGDGTAGDGIAGAGVLIGPRHVLTCAHVVDLALGGPAATAGCGDAPAGTAVTAEFPFASRADPAQISVRAKVVGWAPITEDGSGDAALLELATPVDHVPAPLACPPALTGHPFSVHGFPRGETAARQATGVIRGASGPTGQWVQIEAQSQTGWAIERGFSGGPVFDHHSEAVTGIVVLRDDHRSGHMLPISYLRTLWEEVRRSCGWRLDLDPHLPTHWLPRARGCELGTDEWHFTGRVEARRAIRDWLARPAPAGQPILLVTGGPGCGKSALLAHTLLAADPRLSATVPTPGPRPPAGAFDAALHLKGLTCDETAARLADALGATADEPAELLAAVSGLPPGTSFTVLVDALEEAASAEEARRIAVLLRQVAGTGRLRVLAGVRTAPPDSRHARVLDAFGQRVPRIDLEAPPYLRHADVADYVVNRLRGRARPGSWDLPAIGQAVARRAGHNFLIAQLVSDRLNHPAAAPPHPGTPGWEEQFPESVGQAMEDYLRACAPDAELVRRLLTALAFARGDGLPVGRTWLLMATGLGHGLAPAPADLHDVVQNAAHYLVEHVDPQAGQSTYRLYHDAIDDYLRERCRHPDPQRAITDALTAAVPGPDGQRDWSAADPYTLAHLAGHAAAAGRLDPLLDDPGYLVHALPGPLLTALPAATTAKGALAARVYRTSAYRHRAATPARRCWTLSFDAARHHAPALRRAFDTLLDTLAPRGGSRWRPYFAAGHAPQPGNLAVIGQVVGSGLAAGVADGRAIALVPGPDAVRIWDLEEQFQTGELPVDGTLSATATAVGRDLAALASDGPVDVWDLATRQRIARLEPIGGQVAQLAFARCDGRTLLLGAGHNGQPVRVWDLATERELGRLDEATGPGVATGRLEGRAVAVTLGRHGRGMQVWDLAERRTTRHLFDDDVIAAYRVGRMDGRTVTLAVLTGHDPVAEVRDLATGEVMSRVPLPREQVGDVALTLVKGRPTALVPCAGERSVRVLDLVDGTETARLLGHSGYPYRVVTVRSGERTLAVTKDLTETAMIWDLTGLQPPGAPAGEESFEIRAADLGELDGREVVAAIGADDQLVRVWDLASGQQTARLAGHADRHRRGLATIAIRSWQDDAVAVTSGLNEAVRVWDLGRRRQSACLDVRLISEIVLGDLAGRRIALLRGDGPHVHVWDLTAGRAAGVLGGAPEPAGDRVTIALDTEWGRISAQRGARLALATCGPRALALVGPTGVARKPVQVWDVLAGRRIGRLDCDGLLALAAGRCDGRPTAITCGLDGSIRIWDLLRLGETGWLTPHPGGTTAVAITELGGQAHAVTGGYDEMVRVWDLGTRSVVEEFRVPEWVRGLSVSSRGTILVMYGGSVAAFTTRGPAV
ncbi:trypsin-like peptidase domain-containing protein [Nonomuraea rubra]|uniref:WD40 repeat protein n=1 Tax=Nonomuraea rubra TaxID=46180 RepID=A0A7X0NWL3_9ACTN|nr:trypsin-like peptidase domain-containing protein [Nonomuraea rubra]MBB6550989.1 WD40 repeat protein [Nonomuraea rubra]